jgi:hypothetical protein
MSSSVKPLVFKGLWYVSVTVFVLFSLIVIVRPFFIPQIADHYFFQAQSWLNGRLDINNAPANLIDVVTYKDNRYMPLGAFPTLLTLPFVAVLGDLYKQNILLFFVVAVSVWAGWNIVKKIKPLFSSTHFWLVILFFLSTVFFSCAVQAEGAWYVAHIVTACFILLAINETLGTRRGWLIGLFVGMAAATRFTSLFTFPFFIWLLSVNNPFSNEKKVIFEPYKKIILRLFLFGIGVAIPLSFYFLNNYLRFGSFLESGYNLAVLAEKDSLNLARAEGLFGLVHLPKNLYYFLLAIPEPYNSNWVGNPADAPFLQFPYLKPSPWGMSIFITTPAVIYIFKAGLRQPLVQACWMGIILCAIPILTYYGVGWSQFGYRYALDFTPFIWLLIVWVLREREISYKKPNLAFWLIITGCIINLIGCFWLIDLRSSR